MAENPLPKFAGEEARHKWALRLICQPGYQGERYGCERSMSGVGDCHRRGRTPDAEFTADCWCNSCLAYFALFGGFPAVINSERAHG